MTSWRNWIAWLRPAGRMRPHADVKRDPLPKGTLPLRFRLLLTITIALLPIAIFSVWEGVERARIDLDNVRRNLSQSARMAALDEENIVGSSEQLLRSLGNIADVRDITPECGRTLSDALIGARFLRNLTRVDRNGHVVCSADTRAVGLSMNSVALFRDAKDSMSFAVSGQMISRVTHQPIIGAMLPLRDKNGGFAGTVAASIDVHWLDYILKARDLPPGAVAAVFDRSGTVMATNDATVGRALFARRPEQKLLAGGVLSAPDAKGDSWSFAAAPLLGSNVFVGFAMREAHLLGPTYMRVGTDLLLPIVMIGLAWLAIWFATERQITRWIAYLRRVATAYRGGHYGVRPALDDAPAEFKQLGSAMAAMATGIQERDTSLRDAIAQKTFLIKETHHRVKNNLQVIISLLSLQSNQSRDPAVREALELAQARMNALALVHRILHETDDQTTVNLPRMLSLLTKQIGDVMPVEWATIDSDVEVLPLDVPGDIAVPLALFTVEALTNTYKYAFPAARPNGAISVSLRRVDGDKLRLAIEDNGIGFTTAQMRSGMGARLLTQFGRQIKGATSVRSEPGRGTVVEMIFADPAAQANAQIVPAA